MGENIGRPGKREPTEREEPAGKKGEQVKGGFSFPLDLLVQTMGIGRGSCVGLKLFSYVITYWFVDALQNNNNKKL